MRVLSFHEVPPQSAFVYKGRVYLKLSSPVYISRDGPGHSTLVNAIILSGPDIGRHDFIIRSASCVPCREPAPAASAA